MSDINKEKKEYVQNTIACRGKREVDRELVRVMPRAVLPFTRIARLSTICRKFLLAGRFEIRVAFFRVEKIRRTRIFQGFPRGFASGKKRNDMASVESYLSDFATLSDCFRGRRLDLIERDFW